VEYDKYQNKIPESQQITGESQSQILGDVVPSRLFENPIFPTLLIKTNEADQLI
jgi:hypothetical protein